MGLKDIVDKLNNKYLAWSVYAAGKIGDYFSTGYSLENVSGIEEANPVASYFIDEFGLYNGMAVHTLLDISVISGIYLLLNRYKPKASNWVPFGAGIAALYCTVNNFSHLLK